LKLLERAVEKSKSDYGHHAWGNGAYHMEVWGIAALEAGRLEVAEEAFLEALAHDPGSVRGALGLAVICQRLGRSDEQQRYEQLARRLWARAEVRSFDALRDELARLLPGRVEAVGP
jgi:Flp pilus assembly protein TadD